MNHVYLLESLQDKSWYIGFTPNSPFERLIVHNSGTEYYTKRKTPWKLIYYEAYVSREDATGREKFLKSGSGRTFLKKQLRNYLCLPSSSKTTIIGLPRESEAIIRGPIV